MKAKTIRKSLMTLSICSLAVFVFSAVSFAWFNWNKNIDSGITLVSGASVLYIDMFNYCGKSLTASTEPSAYYYQETGLTSNAVGEADDQGGYQVTIDSNIYSSLGINLTDFYDNENQLDLTSFPKLVFEFRFFKEYLEGFVEGGVNLSAFVTSSDTSLVNVNSSDLLNYRIFTCKNDSVNKYTSGYSQGFTSLEAQSNSVLFPYASSTSGSSFDFFSSSDYADAPSGTFEIGKTPSNQCYVPGFDSRDGENNLLYSKSTLFEVSVNPEKLLAYYQSDGLNSSLVFGVNINVNFKFSNTPYYEA